MTETDETSTETVTETEVETPEVEAPAEETVVTEPEDELPEWARTKLTKANSEAANYRTRLRETEAKLAEAKTPEQFAAALAEVTAKNAELERSVLVNGVAGKHNLPAELAELLKGDDEAALTAHAKTLQKFIAKGKAPLGLNGGLTPGENEADDNDPRKLAQNSPRYR